MTEVPIKRVEIVQEAVEATKAKFDAGQDPFRSYAIVTTSIPKGYDVFKRQDGNPDIILVDTQKRKSTTMYSVGYHVGNDEVSFRGTQAINKDNIKRFKVYCL